MRVEWDQQKNITNQKKHGLSFEEASTLFSITDEYVLEIYDYEHSIVEDRLLSIGPISKGIILVVSTEYEDNTIRIISARAATKNETALYYSKIYGERNE